VRLIDDSTMTGRDGSGAVDLTRSLSGGSGRSSPLTVRTTVDLLVRAILVGLGVGLVVMADPSTGSFGLVAAGILAIGASMVGWSD
jgi:hypothetical protein